MIPIFQDFIEDKPLYYKEIDYERIHVAYAMLKEKIRHPRTVHIVGTNGKGSTGRVLAYLAYKGGLSVGHFSSPHILKFNERIWLNGKDSSDAVLEQAHQKLFWLLGQKLSDALSYFEYTTLLALVAFENLDLIVLEAGLGGEYDASNVCDKALSIITPIGIDHQDFLGDSIEEIANTKIRSIQKQVLLSPQPYDEVLEAAKQISREKDAKLYMHLSTFLSSQKMRELEHIAKQKGWSDYLVDNASVAVHALDILAIPYKIDDLKSLELFGRFQLWKPNIHIDVGHNPLAAQVIVKALAKSVDKKVVLIYNSLDDKDYEEVLRRLKPQVKRVEIITIHSQRAATVEHIEDALKKVELPYSYFEAKIDKNEHYLVFGSFHVVEEFLKIMDSRAIRGDDGRKEA